VKGLPQAVGVRAGAAGSSGKKRKSDAELAGTGGGTGSAGDPPAEPESKEVAARKKLRKDVDQLFAKSKKLKDRSCTATAQAHQLLGHIDKDPTWSWASGGERDDLHARLRAVNDFQNRSAFWMDWYLNETGAMKKKWPDLEVASKEFLCMNSLDECVAALEAKVKMLTAMQRARNEV
jgi:hypothetical protein